MPGAPEKNTLQPEVSSRNGSVEGEGAYTAKRYALKFDPPSIFLEYEEANKKRRVRAVKINGVQPNVDVDRLTRKVIRSFPRKLDPSSVKYDQVRKLVVKIVDYLAASVPAAAAAGRNGPSRLGSLASGGSGSHDGGRLSDCSNPNSNGGSFSSPLPTMSPRLGLVAARLGPHNGLAQNPYRGSVESTMSRFSTSTGCSSDEEGVEEEDQQAGSGGEGEGTGNGGGGGGGFRLDSALDDLEREMADLSPGPTAASAFSSTRANGASASGSSDFMSSRDSSFSRRDGLPGLSAASSLAAAAPPSTPVGRTGSGVEVVSAAGGPGGKSRFAAEAEKLSIGLELTDDLDLNKVTDVELRMAKLAMESDFRKNQLKPGDPGYVYDKQAEFGPPTEDNDWDDSGEEEAPSEEPEVDWEDIQAAVRKPTSVVITAPAPGAKGPSSGEDSSSPTKGKGGQSPYSSNDWP